MRRAAYTTNAWSLPLSQAQTHGLTVTTTGLTTNARSRKNSHYLNTLCAYSKTAEAEPMFRQALADHTRVLGADHPDTITSVNNLATNLDAQGKSAEAEPMYRQACSAPTTRAPSEA